MIRLFFLLLTACAIAGAIAWLAGTDAVVTFVMAGHEWRASAAIALGAALLVSTAILVFLRAVLLLLNSPATFRAWTMRRRTRNFFHSVSHGLIAAASGDAAETARCAHTIDKRLRGQPLALLLMAQAGALSGDEAKQEAAYRAMLKFPETEFLGLRGLFEFAMRHHDEALALTHATRAYALHPKAWAFNALFDLRVSRHEWREAMALIAPAPRNRKLPPEDRRRRAVLLAAQAADAESAGDSAALEYAWESVALAPGLIAPALIAARQLTAQGRLREAQDVIEAAWAEAPHRELAAAYAAAHPSDTPEERAERLVGLAQLSPIHRESRAADWRCSRCRAIAPEWSAVCPHCDAFDTVRWTESAYAEPEARSVPPQLSAPFRPDDPGPEHARLSGDIPAREERRTEPAETESR